MASKLLPPFIEGTLPAFYSKNGTTNLVVPFSMNRGVSRADVLKFALIIKNMQTSTYLSNTPIEVNATDEIFNQQYITFDLSSVASKIKVGQFYKVQIAYINRNDEIGQYSIMSIVKYTSYPTVKIEDLTTSINNFSSYVFNFVGSYIQQSDITEKVYSYRFQIFDGNRIIGDSEKQLHNSLLDIKPNESYDSFTFLYKYELNKTYEIQYTIWTANGLVISTDKYQLKFNNINNFNNSRIKTSLDFENGIINVNAYISSSNYLKKNDICYLVRSSEDTNYSNLEILDTYTIESTGSVAREFIYEDKTFEQGKKYKYSFIRAFEPSQIMESEEIYGDFEHAFLYDGDRQLKIKYNPVLESKVDTIGSKYPFIFRNPNVYYKEFPISGLISYWMDEQEYFIKYTDLGLEANDFCRDDTYFEPEDKPIERYYYGIATNENNVYYGIAAGSQDDTYGLATEVVNGGSAPQREIFVGNYPTTNLVGYNIAAERFFKMNVLDWLNDGNIKLFRSPAEGNFIIRILNVSLSPTDTVGRMLHTFNCTAYEVADFNKLHNDNLFDLNKRGVQ